MNKVLFLVVVCAAFGQSAYYHVPSARLFTLPAPLVPGANFGFSISSLTSSLKLLVGAPLADKLGKIYICDLLNNDANSCSVADRTNIKRFSENHLYDNQNYWYGASVKGGDNFFVGCSPLFVEKDKIFAGGSIGTYGRCYSYSNAKGIPTKLSTITKVKRKGDLKLFEHCMDSFGWSLDIESKNSIVIGGPAVVSGRVMKVANKKTVFYTSGYNSSNTLYNFGYSLATGLFLRTKDHITILAVGTTFGSDGRGKVVFLTDDTKLLDMKSLGELVGEQLGSMFGAVLCSAKLSSVPHRTDLMVGAPAFASRDGYNVGAVYVYVANQGNMMLKRKILGTMSQSFFGSAIVSVGDLNNDKMDEIVIAAPYEDEGKGMVYLYNGADIMSNDNDIQPAQKIPPEPGFKNSFGFSLTALNDYDNNGCKELAIGIPENNMVQVFKCPAAITIKLLKLKDRVNAPTDGKDITEELEVCFSAEIPDKPTEIKADIQVTIQIHHDGASLQDPVDGIIKFNIITKKKIYCEKINLLLSATTGDYNQFVNYDLSASLTNNPLEGKDFKSSEVILNERSELTLSSTIWVQECGDKLCKPKLKMTTTYPQGITDTYILGSSPSIDVLVEVQNTGDVSYSACIRVNVTGATVSLPQGVCKAIPTTEGNLLECKSRQVLRTTNPWNLETISVNTAELTNEDKIITVAMVLYDDCTNLTIADSTSRQFQLRAETEDIVVHGRTDEGVSDLVNLTKSDIAARTSFQHIYTISNGGYSNWVNVEMYVMVQKQDFISRSVHVDNKDCKRWNETDSAELYSCFAQKLSTDEGIEVKVLMQVIPEKINGKIGKEKLTVYSNITVDLDGIPKTANVTSELVLVEAVTPIWIIVAASVLALIILVIIFFILRECGFMKRKNKEELKKVRMSVRRQTMMRRSMMTGQQNQDLDKLVEDTVASSKQAKKRDRRVVVNDF